jgi:hypothetical protein
MRIEFGSYVQLFDDVTPSNTPHARSLGAIALHPTGNAQGAYYFMSLATGARLARHRWTELPITDLAIARVHALALHQGQPLLQLRNFVVENHPDQPIDDSEYDHDYRPLPSHTRPDDDDFSISSDLDPLDDDEVADLHDEFPDDTDFPDDDVHFPPDDDASYTPETAIAAPPAATATSNPHPSATPVDATAPTTFPHVAPPAAPHPVAPLEVFLPGPQGAHNIAPQGAPNIAPQGAPIPAHQGAPTHHLRPRKSPTVTFASAIDAPHSSKSYYPPKAYQFFQYLPPKCIPANIPNTIEPPRLSAMHDRTRHAVQFIFAHVAEEMTKHTTPNNSMTFREGLRRYGKAAETALMNEYIQFNDYHVFEPLNANLLTYEQRRAALRAIDIITEKRNGFLKGRTCADGSTQRPFYSKLETASPTIATDALLISILIDAYEGRDVATADVAGAYLNAYMRDFVIMKFTGDSVRVLCDVNPTHRAFVVYENGVPTLYVRLLKALYGCVQSALLWYELFTKTLQSMGFVLNPYDHCVANCLVEGSQCTICWYVDDTKISHKDPAVVTAVIKKLESHFNTMKVTRGDHHVFLGMHIDYHRSSNTATISMRDYLTEAITESSLSITKTASTPAGTNLFTIDETSPPLSKTSREVFHSVVAKLLYVSLRGRMDLLLTTSFLATRVTKSTQQDLKKLRRLLEYISGSLADTFTLGADDLGRLRTWIDASYAVHPDFKSHTGGAISFGRGALVCKSTKQKLNTKSSTEAETVGASDYFPHNIWVQHFMEAQGYTVSSNILEQDNQSAIHLATNGRSSAGPKSRHIDIRYFWLQDRIKSGNVIIRHCPTLEMLADFFTKPLQGHLFRFFKAVVLGQRHIDTLSDPIAQSLEERVEDHQSIILDTITSPTGRSTNADILPTSSSEDSPELHIHTSNRIQPFSLNQAHSLDSIQ